MFIHNKVPQVNHRVLFFFSKAVVSVSVIKRADDWTLQDVTKCLLKSERTEIMCNDGIMWTLETQKNIKEVSDGCREWMHDLVLLMRIKR